MAEHPTLFYWDSCVFLAYFNSEPGRVETLESILDEVGKKDSRKKIVTSVLAKTEVGYVTVAGGKRLTVEDEKKLDDFWADDSVLELIEFHDGIAKLVRDSFKEGLAQGIRLLKLMDAIHLATAKLIGVKEFHTYDLEHFKPYETFAGFAICEPYTLQARLIRP